MGKDFQRMKKRKEKTEMTGRKVVLQDFIPLGLRLVQSTEGSFAVSVNQIRRYCAEHRSHLQDHDTYRRVFSVIT